MKDSIELRKDGKKLEKIFWFGFWIETVKMGEKLGFVVFYGVTVLFVEKFDKEGFGKTDHFGFVGDESIKIFFGVSIIGVGSKELNSISECRYNGLKLMLEYLSGIDLTGIIKLEFIKKSIII